MHVKLKLGLAAAIVLILAAWNVNGGGVAGESPKGAQERLQKQAELALQAVHADWAHVEMQGRRARLVGEAPTELDLLVARGALRTAAWSGGWLVGGVTDVDSDNVHIAAAREGPYPWRAKLDAGRLELTGAAPSRQTADEIGALAGALFADRRIINNLNVDPTPPDTGWEDAARGALAVLSHLDAGAATLTDFELSVKGEAASEDDAQAARQAMMRLKGVISATSQVDVVSRGSTHAAAPPSPALLPADVSATPPGASAGTGAPPAPAAPTVTSLSSGDRGATTAAAAASGTLTAAAKACQGKLDQALARGGVLFGVGSAALSRDDDPLLTKLAAIAVACPPVTLRIEGHTDDTGVPALNRSLSERRAKAVRERMIQLGVDPQRLTSAGRGASKPVGENATEDGRRANRRIDIVVVAP
jgi:outer membrane protein OmpA-like peptidoglycan-associated protein